MDEATATDNCGGGYHCEEVTTSGACAGEYIITHAFTATDDCGNASGATQTITSTLQHLRLFLFRLIVLLGVLTNTQ